MTTPPSVPEAARAPGSRGPARLAGALLFLPAVLCCAGTLAWPTLNTLLMSLRASSGLDPAGGDFVGLDNYLSVIGTPAFGAAAGFTLLLAVVRALAVGVVPLLLALGLRGLGAAPRALVRLAATVPTALYVPALVGLAWAAAASPAGGLLPRPQEGSWLSDPGRARLFVLFVDGLYALAVGVALGMAAYLAALRGQEAHGRPTWLPLLVVWGVSVLAALASGLQTLGMAFVSTRGGPANATSTLALLQYNLGFVRLAFGPAAALAVMVLAVLMVLGLAAAGLILATRLRLALAAPGRGGGPGGFALLLLGLGLLLFIPACLAAVAVPAWLSTQGLNAEAPTQGPAALPVGRVLVNTLLPPLLAVLAQVAVAWVAALGLSALRPLGRASEWLLLLFAPWLFVTLGPVSLAHFEALRAAGGLNTLAALIPPLRLSVPMLFVLALFFKGQAVRGPAAGTAGFARQVVLPSLPLAALLLVVAWLAGVQEVLWPLLSGFSSELYTASVAAYVLAGSFGLDPRVLGAMLTRLGLPLFLLFALLLGVFQLTLLDRLAAAAGDEMET